MSLPKQLTWDMAQTVWATSLDPLIKNVLTQGKLISNISIITGVNNINHLLSKKQTGFFITDINAAAVIYRSQPFNDKILTLTSNAPCVISVWMF